ERAAEVIRAAKRGASKIPVSVKTRLGYNKDVLEEWLPALLREEPAAVTIHARTRKEMSKVEAHWDRVKRAVEIRNEMGSSALIIGNGDAKDVEDAKQKAQESGADGVMLGRAIFGTPWLFRESAPANHASENSSGSPQNFLQHAPLSLQRPQQSPVAEPATSEDFAQVSARLRIAVEHTRLFEELLGDIKSFAIMKKHFKAYVEGFDGAKELRVKMMEANSADEIEKIVHEFLLARR
ncbi:MAG TPA: tRNA-dihydrouridine synthase, partial [Candidatus Paceibacterota bacterium]|nr:tRNA-dihydrouridine synthase [Candidatus Paceibacterota bacterium]